MLITLKILDSIKYMKGTHVTFCRTLPLIIPSVALDFQWLVSTVVKEAGQRTVQDVQHSSIHASQEFFCGCFLQSQYSCLFILQKI